MKMFLILFGLLFGLQSCAQKEVNKGKAANLYNDVKYRKI